VSLDLDRLFAAARLRLFIYINRCVAQKLRRIREKEAQ
jgi:hypothetical protein